MHLPNSQRRGVTPKTALTPVCKVRRHDGPIEEEDRKVQVLMSEFDISDTPVPPPKRGKKEGTGSVNQRRFTNVVRPLENGGLGKNLGEDS